MSIPAIQPGIRGRGGPGKSSDRGYSVADVSARLRGSSQSLYKWVKAVTPDKTEKQTAELVEAKGEMLRLRAQLRRTEEERDILKEAARYFAKEPE